MISARAVRENDWRQINWLASDAVQEGEHGGIESEWTKNRRAFEGEKYESVIQSDGNVVGYCSLERGISGDGFRAFVILDWRQRNSEVQTAVLGELEGLILNSGTNDIWMRELRGDVSLIEFMLSNGFEIEKSYVHNSLEMVNLRYIHI